MRRDPPEPIKRLLRQEVRFGCPIPGCANPVLTWHHFDPPWNEKQHHNPEGMIALCTQHHPLADGGTWTRSELRSFKENPPDISSIRKRFLWSESEIIYRLGGSYAANCGQILSISGIPVLWDTRSPDGRLLFSLDLRDQYDSQILFLDHNCLDIDAVSAHDLSINTHETHLKIMLAKRCIGLDLHLRHQTIDRFAEQLDKDATRAAKSGPKWLPKNYDLGGTKPDISYILNYAKDNCLDSDGRIAVLDICNSRLFGGGRCVEIRNGIVSGLEFHFCFSYNNGGAAYGL